MGFRRGVVYIVFRPIRSVTLVSRAPGGLPRLSGGIRGVIGGLSLSVISCNLDLLEVLGYTNYLILVLG